MKKKTILVDRVINEKGLKTVLYAQCCQKFVAFSVDIMINKKLLYIWSLSPNFHYISREKNSSKHF